MQLSRNFGLGLGAFAWAMACAGEPDLPEYYEGSCPILIECADVIGTDEQKALFRAAYGVDGNCWSHGPNYFQECRDSCVTALASINMEAQSTGDSCGDCVTDSDCAAFGSDARCENAWCARAKLGDIDDPMADSGAEAETGGDSGSGTVEDEIDPTCLVDAPTVVMETTFGTMTFQLDRVAAKTVSDSFLRHLSSDFYDETIVHRVVDGVLMQSGVYAQGPVLRSGARAQSIGGLPMLGHVDGAIALVVTDQKVAAQWYVTEGAHPELDGTGAVFGKLIDGAGVRDQISSVEVSTLMWMGYELLDYPLVEIVIQDVYCVL